MWLRTLFLFAVVALQAAPAWTAEFHIGVLAHRGPEKTLARWQPIADYLGERLPQHHFVILPLSLEEMRQAVIPTTGLCGHQRRHVRRVGGAPRRDSHRHPD